MFTIVLDWPQLLLAAFPIIIAIGLKFMLDLRLANCLVKYFFWIPVRNIFRDKPIQLSGNWEHIWGSGGSQSFSEATKRHGHSTLRQLAGYCHAEFYSNGKKYVFFGSIKDGYIIGEWYDANDRAGYFGAFQLEIVTSSVLKGIWLGHSKLARDIRHDFSNWTRLDA